MPDTSGLVITTFLNINKGEVYKGYIKVLVTSPEFSYQNRF